MPFFLLICIAIGIFIALALQERKLAQDETLSADLIADYPCDLSLDWQGNDPPSTLYYQMW